MGHIYLSHSHPIAIYACPIPLDVSHGIPIGMTFPWTSLGLSIGSGGFRVGGARGKTIKGGLLMTSLESANRDNHL